MADLIVLLSPLGSFLCERLCDFLEVLESVDAGEMVSIEELILRRLASDRAPLLRFLVLLDLEGLASRRSCSAYVYQYLCYHPQWGYGIQYISMDSMKADLSDVSV